MCVGSCPWVLLPPLRGDTLLRMIEVFRSHNCGFFSSRLARASRFSYHYMVCGLRWRRRRYGKNVVVIRGEDYAPSRPHSGR